MTALISIILSSSDGSTYPAGADVNRDGEVNIGDVTMLISIILNSSSHV